MKTPLPNVFFLYNLLLMSIFDATKNNLTPVESISVTSKVHTSSVKSSSGLFLF